MSAPTQDSLFDVAAPAERAGFRLHRLELYNWGTFHERVWTLECNGENTLVTGDIGSGKSTLVDALTTLLVPPQKTAYNRAAGAEARERTARSYVLGVYKSERGDTGLAARQVSLREPGTYAVLLAHFHNEGFAQSVTLAQVFSFANADAKAQPSRLYVVADSRLHIAEHFAEFGTDIPALRKRLRSLRNVEIFDSFPPYAAAFRRRFGVENEQAFDLFHQTVSMKSVGDLTDFVREHMLQPFDVAPRIEALLHHFDDLNRAHEAVLRAKDQIGRLGPLVENTRRHTELGAAVARLRGARDALRPYFALRRRDLLDRRMDILDGEIGRLTDRQAAHTAEIEQRDRERDELRSAISAQGGDRMERLRAEIGRLEEQRRERSARAERYETLAAALGLPAAADDETFTDNREHADAETERVESDLARVQNDTTEATVDLRGVLAQRTEVSAELASLRGRRSNIPARMLELRRSLCRAVGARTEDELPFAGEVLSVREEDAPVWEGAIERLLHGFGLSLLVPDAFYARVAEWVDKTPLGDRLVYFRMRPARGGAVAAAMDGGPDALWRKLSIKPDSPHYAWLEGELARRFDHVCCTDLDRFRRERKAVTRTGQVKGGEERHEKDDRHRLDDRTRYVLGWSNQAKIDALAQQVTELERRAQTIGDRIATADDKRRRLHARKGQLAQFATFTSHREQDWRSVAVEIQAKTDELRALETTSDVLRTLRQRLAEVEQALREARDAMAALQTDLGTRREKRATAERARAECEAIVAAAPPAMATEDYPVIDALRAEQGDHTLTAESCEGRERELREHLQRRIDTEDKRIAALRDQIVAAMQDYRVAYPVETQDADAKVEAAGEYERMLGALQADDLPRFEARFKELLNENTIREVANFQSQLNRERQLIRERITTINRSLAAIDYNPGRYIALEPEPTPDVEVRQFQQELRACTEGALTGSEDGAYSEAKFLQVRRIIERFRGREGTTDADARWTAKVTDVRRWFVFSASERWREDDREHEHYTDSGGKSGGQKEKLAYTVLAASLAYQFGLEWSGQRSRSFRFVVIDEAFGRGSDESARYGLELFAKLHLQLLIVTPLQKIHVIEPHVSAVGFVHNEAGQRSLLRNLTIEAYRRERDARRSGPA